MLMKVYSCIKILKIALSYGMSHKTPSQKKHHKKVHRKKHHRKILYRYLFKIVKKYCFYYDSVFYDGVFWVQSRLLKILRHIYEHWELIRLWWLGSCKTWNPELKLDSDLLYQREFIARDCYEYPCLYR